MESFSINKAFADSLIKLANKHKNLVVLSSDFVETMGLTDFKMIYKDRHFNFGLAEGNMVSASVGFVIRGKIPVLSILASSLSKALDQIKNCVCYSNVNVKIVGGFAGIRHSEDGPGFQAIDDIAIMRALPNMKVLSPADYYEALSMFEKMIFEYGPVYIRIPEGRFPVMFDENYEFRFGKSKVLKEGKDICIFATGVMVGNCMKVADLLNVEGIEASVVNVSSIKPLDKKTILNASKEVKLCVSVEDHNVIGGLGSAIAEVLAENNPKFLKRIGILDRFSDSGKREDVYRKNKLDIYGICELIRDFYKEV